MVWKGPRVLRALAFNYQPHSMCSLDIEGSGYKDPLVYSKSKN